VVEGGTAEPGEDRDTEAAAGRATERARHGGRLKGEAIAEIAGKRRCQERRCAIDLRADHKVKVLREPSLGRPAQLVCVASLDHPGACGRRVQQASE